MFHSCGVHRAPRAGIDVIDGPVAALAIIDLAMSEPLAAETIVVVLDDSRRGRSIVVVDGTDDPDAVCEVVERLAETIAGVGAGAALIVASVRPRDWLAEAAEQLDDDEFDELDLFEIEINAELDDDAERWERVDELAAAFGVELIEWFVISPHPDGGLHASMPRAWAGDEPRWPAP